MHPLKRFGFSAGLAGALAAASASAASDRAARVDIQQGALQAALVELARENGVEILFDEALVRGRTTKGLRARLTPEQALAALLSGTGVGHRSTPDGSFVLYRLPSEAIADDGDGAIAELLVIGRRTQNADIRRTENDIQPYQIAGPRELAVAQQDTVGQVLRDRFPANAQAASPTQEVLAGARTNSAIDLRGVGTQRTLVLIDGRRLPGLPTERAALEQGDLNALPIGAIERIEVLTATAGGIHGPSALGGAVNVVLRRDYRGADLTVASGLSDRGDAGRVRLEGRLGFTPNQGDTDVMIAAAYARAQPLEVGDRDYAARSIGRQAANNPQTFMAWSVPADGVIVRSLSGAPLKLDPSLGGAQLPAAYTFLPVDFTGDAAARSGVLAANAGRLPTAPPPGRAGEATSLVNTAQTASLLLNIRHRLSDRLEGFVDGLYLSSRGRSDGPTLAAVASVHADAPSNPFTEAVVFSIPTPGLYEARESRIEAHRLTAGLIATLPGEWQASADYTAGRAVVETRREGRRLLNRPPLFGYGLPGPNGLPPLEPLGDFAALTAALAAYASDTRTETRLANHFSEASIRAAGPLAALPGGPLTLTLLGGVRRERMPEGSTFNLALGPPSLQPTPERTQTVRSGYVELRAPLAPPDAAFPLVRGLEFQLALRRDDVRTRFPENILTARTLQEGHATLRHQADVFTAGARVFPAPWLMLRASVATGEAPPDLRHVQEQTLLVAADHPSEPRDPQRGGRRVTQDGAYLWVRGGFRPIGQEKGRTTSAGVVLNPSGRSGPRLSVDVSRIDVRDEIVPLPLSVQQLLDAEARYPDRVVREPLSPADAALGYTAGRVVQMHVGMINGGRTVTETVDVQLDWALPPTRLGQARLYGAATWQPTFRSRVRADGPLIERAGYRDAPLKWRGNGGVQWTHGPTIVDLNLQYFGARQVASSAADIVATGPERVRFQGAAHIPSQVYVDLAVRRSFELPPGGHLRAFDVRLGVQNLLDRSPPILADSTTLGYDYYGDPRRRRFEVLLTAKF
ncbi:TonB-dependent receptor [Phenylobacterium terrae]|uniref:TonB-dependent receptor n=1 Tax=Phenylobacterium terrae TaxID=2665495 RepID=A0ABW4N884_9CAUL